MNLELTARAIEGYLQKQREVGSHPISTLLIPFTIAEWEAILKALRSFEAVQRDIRDKALTDAADRLHEEYLTDKTGDPSDDAYNAAVSHCIGAVLAMHSTDIDQQGGK